MTDYRGVDVGQNRFFKFFRRIMDVAFKVAEHSFQVPMPNSPLLLNYLCIGAHFLHE